MLPPAFATPKVLRRLNIAAVGLALSASTASIVGATVHEFFGLIVGVPTLVMGLLWAWILRLPNKVVSTNLRWGWLASVPLFALAAGLAGATTSLLMGEEQGGPALNFFVGMLAGMSAVFVWVPALLLTLFAFGVPMAWGQTVAKSGLALEKPIEHHDLGPIGVLDPRGLVVHVGQPDGHAQPRCRDRDGARSRRRTRALGRARRRRSPRGASPSRRGAGASPRTKGRSRRRDSAL